MRKYEAKEARVALAREIAQESIVLLENKNRLLPFTEGKQVALFGRAQLETHIGGGGSGASDSKEATNILDECIRAGLCVVSEAAEFYRTFVADAAAAAKAEQGEFSLEKLGDLVASGLIYEIFGRYQAPSEEAPVSGELLRAAAAQTDTAILVIGRCSGGEECDRRRDDDYYLLESEKQLIDAVCGHFPKVAVVFNINGAVDMSWIREQESIQAVLFMGTPGEQGAAALADILTGKANPSGRLPATFALRYEDYPGAADFSFNKDDPDSILEYKHYGLDAQANGSRGFEKSPVTVYREGIYMGYRYFDTFRKPVMYPFGFGLSYADFDIQVQEIRREGTEMKVRVAVANASGKAAGEPSNGVGAACDGAAGCASGRTSGKEVVQVYVSVPGGRLEQPYRKLVAFGKTGLLAPGEKEELELTVPLMEFASYDEGLAAYVLEPGDYFIRVGSTGCSTHVAGKVTVTEEAVVQKLANRLKLTACNRGKVEFLSAKDVDLAEEHYPGERAELEGAACVFTLGAEDGALLGAAMPRMDKGRAGLDGKEKPDEAPSRKEKLDMALDGQEAKLAGSGRPEAEGVEACQAAARWQWQDVKEGTVSLADFVAQMSVEELAVLANGYGPGLPFGGMGGKYPNTICYEDGTDIAVSTHKTGNLGYVSPALPRYGIPSVFYKDGPAGVRMTAWPTGMVLACSFNPQIAYEFGAACGYEAETLDVDSWLAPALNLHRNPLGGRNFEYFGEDPLLAGMFGLMVARGVEENNHVTTCPKHFALNEQETYRRGSKKKSFDAADTIVEERVARELYLKPFEMVVRGSQVKTVMTSFNKINGTFAGGSRDLCTGILREEWGFDGVVVTDWGDMDIVVDGADAVAAGNDVVMPGGPPVIEQVLAGFREGRVSLEELREAAGHLLVFVLNQG